VGTHPNDIDLVWKMAENSLEKYQSWGDFSWKWKIRHFVKITTERDKELKSLPNYSRKSIEYEENLKLHRYVIKRSNVAETLGKY